MRASVATVLFLSLLSMACLLGCGGPKKVLGRVAGKVTFKGQPVSGGLVIFTNREKGIHIMAKLGPDGTYEVETADGLGLPPASYQVSITPPVPDAPVGQIPKPQGPFKNIPNKYRRSDTSGLTLTVEETENAEDTNSFDVDMLP